MTKLIAAVVLMSAAVCGQTKKDKKPLPAERWQIMSLTKADSEQGWISQYRLCLPVASFTVSVGKNESGVAKVWLYAEAPGQIYTAYEEGHYRFGVGQGLMACDLRDLFRQQARKREGLPPEIKLRLDLVGCAESKSLRLL